MSIFIYPHLTSIDSLQHCKLAIFLMKHFLFMFVYYSIIVIIRYIRFFVAKEGSSDYKKDSTRWFFKEPLTEWFFVEPFFFFYGIA